MSSAAEASVRAKRIPLRDFFRNPERASFQISPDGNTLAFMQPYQNRMNVFVQPRAGGEPLRLTSETERDVAGYFWKGSRRIVYLKDFKGDENFHLVAADVAGGQPVDLTPFDKVRAQIIDDRYDNDDEMLVALNKRNPESPKIPAMSSVGSPTTPARFALRSPPMASTPAFCTGRTTAPHSRT
jgi:hypothetical protein